jgi:hypothetical protein
LFFLLSAFNSQLSACEWNERKVLSRAMKLSPAAGYLLRPACFYSARIARNSMQYADDKTAASRLELAKKLNWLQFADYQTHGIPSAWKSQHPPRNFEPVRYANKDRMESCKLDDLRAQVLSQPQQASW